MKSHENPSELIPGNTFDKRYRIEGKIAQGGTAGIWKAYDPREGRPVALKVYTDPTFSQGRIDQEANILRVVGRHHHILTLHRSGTTADGVSYLDTELAQGDIRGVLKKAGKLPADQAVTLIANAADAVDYAHNKTYLHRDLKPSSILFASEITEIRVGDWGIAMPVPDSAPQYRSIERWEFTSKYCAPEQLFPQGIATIQSDIYVLGLDAYEVVTGRSCVIGNNILTNGIQQRFVPPPPFERVLKNDMTHVHAAIEEPIRKAFAKNPANRQQSMAEYRDELLEAYRRGREYQTKETTVIDLGKNRNNRPFWRSWGRK